MCDISRNNFNNVCVIYFQPLYLRRLGCKHGLLTRKSTYKNDVYENKNNKIISAADGSGDTRLRVRKLGANCRECRRKY